MPDPAFSDPARRIAALADDCVKCGLCLPHCPTYALEATETESPRGRIALAAGGTSGALSAGAELRLHLDHCLGCMACERVCPVPVHYGALLTQTRAAIPPARPRPRLLLNLLSRPQWLHGLAVLARLTGARHWLPKLTRVLPADSALRAAAGLLPALPRQNASHEIQQCDAVRASAPRGRAAVFAGCVQSVFERDAQLALQKLLNAAGYDVAFVSGLCCGALAAHTGDAQRAQRLAADVRSAVAHDGADILLTATPGCLGTLRAALPGRDVQDALAFLDAHAKSLRFRALPLRAALHLPCTQVNVAQAGDAVQRLLARIPQLHVDTLPTQAQCCGAAGSHMLEFPLRAAAYRNKILARLPKPAPDLLLTSNIGCRLHLAAGLQESGSSLTIEHPLTLFARQLKPNP